jgi:uncharacterized protein (TIGR02246 family)
MRFLLPTLLLIALFPFNAQAGTQDDEALVRAHVGKLTTTWNSHDMKAFAQLFSDDAQFVNVVGMWWKNRSEIEAAHVASHRTHFKDSTLTSNVATVKWLSPDIVLAQLSWQLTGSKGPNGEPMPARKGLMMLVLTRDRGGWMIRAAQNTDIVEGAMVPPPSAKKN